MKQSEYFHHICIHKLNVITFKSNLGNIYMEETTNKDQDGPLKSKNESGDTQRPNIITIMCALYIFHVIGIIFAPFSDKAWSIGFWWPPYLGF